MSLRPRTWKILTAAAALPVLAVLVIPDVRQAAWRRVVPRAEANASAVTLEAVLADRKLHVTLADGTRKTYAVAIGTRAYPTPTGSFSIRRIVWNPGWVPPNSPWARKERPRGPRDPANPMKVAKIFFREPDYYIHGTAHVNSLGTAASHGCLRMHPDEVAQLGALVMQAGGVAHDWDWVKRTLRVGSTRTVNLKQPVRIRIVPGTPRPKPAPTPAPADTATGRTPSAPRDSAPAQLPDTTRAAPDTLRLADTVAAPVPPRR